MIRSWWFRRSASAERPVFQPPPGERLLVNGIAKSGTHLLTKVASLMGYPVFPFCLAADKAQKAVLPWTRAGEARLGRGIAVGLERPTLIHEVLLRQTLRVAPAGQTINAHCGYSPELHELLSEEGFRVLILLRDPRDILVSLVRYLSRHDHPALKGLSLEQQLLLAIDGIPPIAEAAVTPLRQQNVAENCRSITAWSGLDGVLTLRFEDLVGPQGGGSEAAQQAALSALSGFLGCSEDRLDGVTKKAFGGTRTFDQGRVGRWREAFTPKVTARFKAVVGEELVRLGYATGDGWQP